MGWHKTAGAVNNGEGALPFQLRAVMGGSMCLSPAWTVSRHATLEEATKARLALQKSGTYTKVYCDPEDVSRALSALAPEHHKEIPGWPDGCRCVRCGLKRAAEPIKCMCGKPAKYPSDIQGPAWCGTECYARHDTWDSLAPDTVRDPEGQGGKGFGDPTLPGQPNQTNTAKAFTFTVHNPRECPNGMKCVLCDPFCPVGYLVPVPPSLR
jgi:hypothetical protein